MPPLTKLNLYCSGFASVLGIILNPIFGFNNLVVVHSLDEFFYSVAWLGAVSLIMGTIVGQVTGYYADRYCISIDVPV